MHVGGVVQLFSCSMMLAMLYIPAGSTGLLWLAYCFGPVLFGAQLPIAYLSTGLVVPGPIRASALSAFGASASLAVAIAT